MPGEHRMHEGEPGPLHEPAAQGAQEGPAPAAQDHERSRPRICVAPEPEEPAAHEKAYDVAPRTGAAGAKAV